MKGNTKKWKRIGKKLKDCNKEIVEKMAVVLAPLS